MLKIISAASNIRARSARFRSRDAIYCRGIRLCITPREAQITGLRLLDRSDVQDQDGVVTRPVSAVLSCDANALVEALATHAIKMVMTAGFLPQLGV